LREIKKKKKKRTRRWRRKSWGAHFDELSEDSRGEAQFLATSLI